MELAPAALEVSFLLDLVIMIMFLVADMSCTRCGYSGCARRGNTYSDKVTVRLERHLVTRLVGRDGIPVKLSRLQKLRTADLASR